MCYQQKLQSILNNAVVDQSTTELLSKYEVFQFIQYQKRHHPCIWHVYHVQYSKQHHMK